MKVTRRGGRLALSLIGRARSKLLTLRQLHDFYHFFCKFYVISERSSVYYQNVGNNMRTFTFSLSDNFSHVRVIFLEGCLVTNKCEHTLSAYHRQVPR